MTKIQNSKLFRTLEFRILRLFRISKFGFRIYDQSGQVALIMLLVMVVMLTLGVSVAQRGVTDVRISKQEEDSARAFQAAETGVEEALSTLAGATGTVDEDVSYQVTVAQSGSDGFDSGQPMLAGETMLVDLTGASQSLSKLKVYFSEQGKDDCSSNPAAIEVSVLYYEVGNEARVRREGFDFKARDNNFTLVGQGAYSFGGKIWCGQATVNLTGNDQQVRLRPVYNRAMMAIEPQPDNATLGNQYLGVSSLGKTTGGVSRAVEVQRGTPQLPAVFDYALFSGGGIIKGD